MSHIEDKFLSIAEKAAENWTNTDGTASWEQNDWRTFIARLDLRTALAVARVVKAARDSCWGMNGAFGQCERRGDGTVRHDIDCPVHERHKLGDALDALDALAEEETK